MYAVEHKKGKRKAKEIRGNFEISSKNITVLESDGKKIMKNIDANTFKLKFG